MRYLNCENIVTEFHGWLDSVIIDNFLNHEAKNWQQISLLTQKEPYFQKNS